MALIAALPMYDWPEVSKETDAEWRVLRRTLIKAGFDLPEGLVRRNADLPAVPGGIRDETGTLIAPDPATLPQDRLDLAVLWRHPQLACAQTCWGPLECGLHEHVEVVGQPDYSAFKGGVGENYRSAVIMRAAKTSESIDPPNSGRSCLPVDEMRGKRLACNSTDSLSGLIALRRDLSALGALAREAEFESFWAEIQVTGSHRQSMIAVAQGKADIAAIDCRTLDLCVRFEPAMSEVRVVGWTNLRRGLPYIVSKRVFNAMSRSSSG